MEKLDLSVLRMSGASLTAEEKALLAQAAKERADIIDKYDKVTPVYYQYVDCGVNSFFQKLAKVDERW